jgi:hypothetical protein
VIISERTAEILQVGVGDRLIFLPLRSRNL